MARSRFRSRALAASLRLLARCPRRPASLGALAALVLLGVAGCGYRLGYRAHEGVRTVAIPIFDNATFPLRRDVEYDLTRALRGEVQRRTTLRLASSERADLVVYGKILDFTEGVVAEGRADEKLESTLSITVELVVEDHVEGTVVRQRVQDWQPFSIVAGETIEVARRRAVENLAEKILLVIEPW